MHAPAVRATDWVRLIGGLTLLVTGLIVVLPAPNDQVWLLSVLLIEGGHWAVLAVAPLLWPGWRRSRVGVAGVALGLLGGALLLSPAARAVWMSDALPELMKARFGTVDRAGRAEPAVGPRPAPVVLGDLFLGVDSPDVRVEEYRFARAGAEDLRLDLYRPDGDHSPLPGVVMIHGGSWQGGSRKDFPSLNRYLASRGYLVAAISYRLAPQFRFPAARDDVAEAIRFLTARAGTLGLDAGRLALVGRSAGAQLALISAYTLRDPRIRGVVSFYGPVALRWGYANPAKRSIIDSSGVLDAYLGGPPTTHGRLYDAASPLAHVGHQTPPTLLISGLRDELVSPFHAEFLSDRLLRASVPHLLLRLPWAVHGCDYLFRGPCGQVSTYAIERFLAAVLGSPGSD